MSSSDGKTALPASAPGRPGSPAGKRSPARLLAAALAVGLLVSGGASAAPETDCYLAAMAEAADSVTMGEIRARCAASPPALQTEVLTAESPAALTKKKTLPDEPSASFTQQIAAERQSLDRSYSLTPHLPNYLLGYSLRNNPDLPEDQDTEDSLEKEEVVLQISVKFPVWRRIFRTDNDILFAYTGKSWFQAYNSELSAPFRETNYEPEIFWRHYGGFKLPLGVRIAGWDLGYNHESNGRSEPLSRSWDRLMSRLALDITPNLSMILRAWYRIPEKADSDDNPDIDDYMGYGDLRAIWTPNRNTFTAMFRPGTRKHGLEFTWSYPITKHFRIYTQYFNGYGESLIDYDRKVERIGIGFAINDFLQVQ